jgi:hypothetical protein
LEFYRNVGALRHRTGVFESLVGAYCNTETSAVVDDVAHSEAAQHLHHIKAAKEDEAIAQEGSDKIVIAVQDLWAKQCLVILERACRGFCADHWESRRRRIHRKGIGVLEQRKASQVPSHHVPMILYLTMDLPL